VRMSSGNIFAVRAARASLGDEAFLTDTRRRIIAVARASQRAAAPGLAYAHPQPTLCSLTPAARWRQFDQFMKARNILVGRLFPPYNNWCRITIGTEPETAAFCGVYRPIQANAPPAEPSVSRLWSVSNGLLTYTLARVLVVCGGV